MKFRNIIAALLLMFVAAGASAQTAADSISIYLGRTQGAMLNRQLNAMPGANGNFRQGLLKGLEAVLTVDTTEIGYTEGLQMGLAMLADLKKFRQLGTKVDYQTVYNELRQGVLGPKADEATINADNQTLSRLLMPMLQRARDMEEAQRKAEVAAYDSLTTLNLDAADRFIDSLRKADQNVKVLPSGLLYQVIEKGKGPHPKADEQLDVIYTGKFLDGEVFDSSNGEPRQFRLSGVIRGFAEGLALMNKGAHYILYIPGDLAYGAKGIPGKIGPMQMLIFDVTLANITRK